MTTEQSIIENNKLIAEFMGYFYKKEGEIEYWNHNDKYIKPRAVTRIDKGERLEFNTSWDWLMPVVEKIENTNVVRLYAKNWQGVEVRIFKTLNTGDNYCEINHIRHSGNKIITITHNKESKIQCVYEAVIDFINWYNESK